MYAADLALLAIALLWGFSFVVVKDVLREVPPLALLALRFALAAAALAAARPGALRRASPLAWRAGLWLGGALAAAFALQTVGLAHTTPSRSAFLTAAYVFLVPLLGFAFGRERVGGGVALGALLATAGLALLTHPEVGAEVRRGDVLSALCALGFAVHILGLARVASRVPAAELALTQLLAAALLLGAAALALDPAGLSPAVLRRVGAGAWLGIAFLGLGCTTLAYFVQTWAQQRTPPARAALLFALEPAFAAAISVALGRERLEALQVLGGLLIVAGVAWAEARPRARGGGEPGPRAGSS
jgi:drug/metabolite transporter (DMT)-like permease